MFFRWCYCDTQRKMLLVAIFDDVTLRYKQMQLMFLTHKALRYINSYSIYLLLVPISRLKYNEVIYFSYII